MKIKALTATLAVSFLGAGLLPAQWTLLHDFANLDGWDITYNRGGFGELINEVDPLDPENRVFYLESGGYGLGDANTNFAAMTLPTPVDEGDTVTLFWRYYETGPGNTFHITFTDVAKVQDEDGTWVSPAAFGPLETIYRIGTFALPAETSARDANRYPRVGVGDSPENFVPFVHRTGTWYNMWMVVRNEVGIIDDTYSLWVQGGQFRDPTILSIEQIGYQVNELTGEYPTDIAFRNGAAAPLVSLVVFTESGWAADPLPGDPWYIDDLYIAPGENITIPAGVVPPVTWHGYVIDAEGYSDTGDWMGVVYVVDPYENWAYSFELGQWVYVGTATNDGGWVYIMK